MGGGGMAGSFCGSHGDSLSGSMGDFGLVGCSSSAGGTSAVPSDAGSGYGVAAMGQAPAAAVSDGFGEFGGFGGAAPAASAGGFGGALPSQPQDNDFGGF
eukprot:scaffold11665_cov45-Isochrysis_galbana.AAC.1